MNRLQGQRALVTGASAGIGRATARALGAAGAELLLLARRSERLRELVREFPSAQTLEVDVREASKLAETLANRRVDILVANAGLALGVEPLQSGSPEDWSVVIDTNIKGVLHCVRAVLPGMLERGRGDIVFLGSVAGRQVYPGGNVYCATKWAVRALYESLRLDVAGKGIRVSSVDPGLVETEFSQVRFKGDTERAAKVYQGYTPLSPADVADAITYVVTRPAHVNIGELVLWPTDQASPTVLRRDNPPPAGAGR